MPKARSTGIDPASTKPSRMPDRVITGSSALGSACSVITIRPVSPFARAVRTKSSRITSSREERAMRVIYAAWPRPSTTAGPMMI